ncbi:MAG: DUF58 domain-containing protein [Planctomycetes bacterium]|nr:DUF58 domain-containing protein [Planctomycetota bacterium]
MPEPVFDHETRRAIAALRLTFGRSLQGEGGASARSRRAGRGQEFHDHRGYVLGDDPRHIDWNLYGRLGELFVKRFRAEADLELRILLDRSGSMELGRPRKALMAARLAGALAALMAGFARDLEIRGLAPGLPRIGPTRPGAGAVEAIFAAIEALAPGAGRTALAAAGPELAAARNRLVVLISDFLDEPEELDRVLARRSPRCDVLLLGVLAAEELDFGVTGLVDFVDVEGGAGLGLRVDESMIAGYRRLLEERLETVARLAARHGGRFVLLRSDLALVEALDQLLRRGGLR